MQGGLDVQAAVANTMPISARLEVYIIKKLLIQINRRSIRQANGILGKLKRTPFYRSPFD